MAKAVSETCEASAIGVDFPEAVVAGVGSYGGADRKLVGVVVDGEQQGRLRCCAYGSDCQVLATVDGLLCGTGWGCDYDAARAEEPSDTITEGTDKELAVIEGYVECYTAIGLEDWVKHVEVMVGSGTGIEQVNDVGWAVRKAKHEVEVGIVKPLDWESQSIAARDLEEAL